MLSPVFEKEFLIKLPKFCGQKIHFSWKESERTVCSAFWFALCFLLLFPIYWQFFKMGYSTDRWSYSVQVHKDTSHSDFWPTLIFLWKLMKGKILKEASDLFQSFLLLADQATGENAVLGSKMPSVLNR